MSLRAARGLVDQGAGSRRRHADRQSTAIPNLARAVPVELYEPRRDEELGYRREAERRRRRRRRRLTRAVAIAAIVAAVGAVVSRDSGILDDPAPGPPPTAPRDRAYDAGLDAAPEDRAAGPGARSSGGELTRQRTRRLRRLERGIRFRPSTALGTHDSGRLVGGVMLPREGRHFVTWDPELRRSPNRAWRRYGMGVTIRKLLTVLNAYAAAHPGAARVVLGDLSRPRGGDFGRRYGKINHVSHQNGLDVDVYYPRRDGRERAPLKPGQVDRALAQDLVERFVAAGASRIFVGRRFGLTGPPATVQPWPKHDDHLHVRFPNPNASRARDGG
jgi:hypothetical protein